MAENTLNFDNYGIQEVFYQFYTAGKTGQIKVLFSLNIVKTIYFSDGDIVFATSNSEKDKLTNILIKNKKITKEQLNMAIKQMDKSISLGRNLVNMGLITHKELVWAVKIQILSIVYSALMLKEGEYQIVEDFLPEGIIKLPFNTLKILFDSLILFKDKDWISEQVSPDIIFRKTNIFDEYKEKVFPNSKFEKIYDLIDGNRSVGEITGMVDIEDFKVYKLFYALKFLKLIEENIEEISSSLHIIGDELDTGEKEDLYEVRGDDTENIQMVEELIGEENKNNDVAFEFEGGASEFSAFEEEIDHSNQISNKELQESNSVMDDFTLNESDFEESQKSVDFEESEEARETVLKDKNEYLEKLQQQLDGQGDVEEIKKEDEFKLEFDQSENEELEESKKTMPVSSPYETAKQQIDPDFQSSFMADENEGSFVVEEEYVTSDDGSMAKYVILMLLLFIAALGFLGYNYYNESFKKNNNDYSKPKQTVKVIEKKKDITSQDITVNKIDEKLGVENKTKALNKPETKNTVEEKNNEKKPEAEAKQEKNNTRNVKAPITYEAVPVYENEANNTKNNSEKEGLQEKTVNKIESDIQKGDYQEYIDNSKTTLVSNPEAYTIQLELACQKETLDKALELLQDKNDIFFIPAKYRGTTCFIICYGIFNTYDETKVAMDSLDGEFFRDNKPIIKQGKQFKKYF